MSTQNPPLIAGLAASGLLWLATSVADAQVGPTSTGPAPISAPASTPSSKFAVLLMSNGTVVRGEITEDPQAGVYRLKCRGGQVPYPKNAVKKAAGSVEELYQYQVACLPPRDPDERMKLVRWCLTEHLTAQAREQLKAVLAICPDDAEATRMAKNMDANAEAAGRLDPEIRRTAAEMPRAEAPAALDSRVLKDIRKRYGNNALPEIFDLPQAVAVSRAAEFARSVHPVLQQNCAGCHNERYQGKFQLVAIKIAKDLRNPDVARANLDATLRLINPDDPTRSELLSESLGPHGPRKNGIFKGTNDPQYQILGAWARSLRPAPARPGGENVSRAGYDPATSGTVGGFGSDRPGREVPPVLGSAARRPAADGEATSFGGMRVGSTRPSRPTDPSAEMTGTLPPVLDGGVPLPSFPRPFTVGGAPPAGEAPSPATRRQVAHPPGKTEAGDDAEPFPDQPPLPTEASPRSVIVEATDDPNKLPGMDKPRYPTLPKSNSAGMKKPKLDPALLEKMIKSRNANP